MRGANGANGADGIGWRVVVDVVAAGSQDEGESSGLGDVLSYAGRGSLDVR